MIRTRAVVIGFAVVAATAPVSLAQDDHVALAPDGIEWMAAPPSIPSGAEAAVLYGDPSKEGLFVLRLKLPAGYTIAPHTHPKPEIVTVISGSFRIGMGETADKSQTEILPSGGFVALPPDMAHYVFIDEETVVQLNSTGPWSLNYINPEDDPRQTSQ